MPGNRSSDPQTLTQRRELAVTLRLQQKKLHEIETATGLSRPTIIALYKKFTEGGWEALRQENRGRPSGQKALPEEELKALIAEMEADQSKNWGIESALGWLQHRSNSRISKKTLQRYLQQEGLIPKTEQPSLQAIDNALLSNQRKSSKTGKVFTIGLRTLPNSIGRLVYQGYCMDLRHKLSWTLIPDSVATQDLITFIEQITPELPKQVTLILKLPKTDHFKDFISWLERYRPNANILFSSDFAISDEKESLAAPANSSRTKAQEKDMTLTHLQRLEAQSIQIMREVVSSVENPVMLYSVGKDSAVMLHIAMKAFYPSPPPFPLLHVDTRWKFREMYEFRDQIAKDCGLDLIVHINQEGVEKNINPFTHGSAIHTDIMKTESLKQALSKYKFDAAFGGARRDEEKSRAKERVFSFRTSDHRWDPKNQRPELWKQYNARIHKGESIRVFPLSNWTELDIWQYIYLEQIPIVPLYYAAERPVVERDGVLIMVDDHRMPLQPGEVPTLKKVRFRTLGCYPLTGAIESEADTLPAIIQEMLLTRTSERQGRVIDSDSAASMEKKKQEGYF